MTQVPRYTLEFSLILYLNIYFWEKCQEDQKIAVSFFFFFFLVGGGVAFN